MARTACRHIRPLKRLWGWAIAIAGSLVLNITLFGLMPGLIQGIPEVPDMREDLNPTQVIRIKRVETLPRRKEPKKISPPRPVKQIRQTTLTRVRPQKPIVRPKLKFELNARLPEAPMDLAVPSLETVSMDIPVLKNIYDITELDTGLTALVKLPPVYPGRARAREIEGFVTVEFAVTPEGLVRDIKIIQSKPPTLFDKSVTACVARWKFHPPTVEGIPVTAKARTTIRFKLEDN